MKKQDHPTNHFDKISVRMQGRLKFSEIFSTRGSKLIFGFWGICATRCKFLGALPKFFAHGELHCWETRVSKAAFTRNCQWSVRKSEKGLGWSGNIELRVRRNHREEEKWNSRWFKENDVTLLFGAWLCHIYPWIHSLFQASVSFLISWSTWGWSGEKAEAQAH